jgi:dipeptidase E
MVGLSARGRDRERVRAQKRIDHEDQVKLLLTSAGIRNPSIKDALVGLLGKPIAESSALCIPTASYGHPMVTPVRAWQFISGRESRTPMTELGWKSLGVLELTALPSIGAERWVPWVREADVLLVSGGDALYLTHWMRESGLADLLPTLPDTVWAGLSAGSMVMTPRVGDDFVQWRSPSGGDEALGVVDFSIFPQSIIRSCRRTRWPPPNDGPRVSGVRHTRSTTRPRSRWSTTRSRSSPRDTGGCSSLVHCNLAVTLANADCAT